MKDMVTELMGRYYEDSSTLLGLTLVHSLFKRKLAQVPEEVLKWFYHLWKEVEQPLWDVHPVEIGRQPYVVTGNSVPEGSDIHAYLVRVWEFPEIEGCNPGFRGRRQVFEDRCIEHLAPIRESPMAVFYLEAGTYHPKIGKKPVWRLALHLGLFMPYQKE